MLPTSAMMRTTVKTKNIASAPRGQPLDRGGRDVCFAFLRAVNVRDETTCLSMANVDVLDLGLLENSGDCRLGRSVIYFFASGYPSIAAVTFEHERQRTKG